ncbi:major facilitator transporter [Caballeronia fortuita]|uniref:Major facilitator transporter n=2 Tax=Caballeronia fortuita TaxID=1777138 RepID=A0A158C9M1_9BURK|nr:major facilitator transporter [Caballeronia fortuita]
MSVTADPNLAASERAAQAQSMARRAVAGATVGTALEWFDFALYGVVAATIFPKLFFPSLDPTASLLASLASFWAGLAARPLGAVICGMLGDRWGRRNLMLVTVSVMGASSFLMGLLPTYQQVGILAPILLVSLRIVQGFALGGESTGAQLMAVEHASASKRGLYSGLLGICSPLSQILANFALFALSALLSADDFESFGWRIPFLASFVLVLLGIYIRMKVSETPAFEALRKKGEGARAANPLGIVFRFHWRTALRLTLFFCGPAALFYLIVVFSLSYLTKNLGVPKQTGFMLLMVANVCAIAGALAGGYLSDRIGRKRALMIGSFCTLICCLIYFPILNQHSVAMTMAVMGAFLGFTQFQSGIQPVWFAESFPTEARYTGSALSYSGANLLTGGPMPIVAVALLNAFHGSPWAIVAVCGSLNLLSFLMIATSRETRDTALERSATH